MHHLLPQLPYHALALAHRRVMAAIPPDSPFHTCQHRSMLAGIRAAIAMRGRYS
jgi:fatty acid desaturase